MPGSEPDWRPAEAEAQALAAGGQPLQAAMPLPTFNDYPPLPTIYLMRQPYQPLHLPRGHVVLLVGWGGVGKGSVIAWLIGAVTRGETLAGMPGCVIMVSPEDHAQESTAWRLRAVSADTGRVLNMTKLPGGDRFRLDATGKTMGSIPQLSAVTEYLYEHGHNPLMVTIDPLRKCVRGSIQTDDGAMRVMEPLMDYAEEYGTTVIAAHHFTKAGEVSGNQGLVNSARLVYQVEQDPVHANVKIISVRKTNILGTDVVPARYIITGQGKDAHVLWGGAPRDDPRAIPAWKRKAITAGPREAIETTDDVLADTIERLKERAEPQADDTAGEGEGTAQTLTPSAASSPSPRCTHRLAGVCDECTPPSRDETGAALRDL